jgi:hypothetical protein
MKSKRPHLRLTCALIVAVALAFCMAASRTAAQDAPMNVATLAWMAGDWQTPAGGRMQSEEHWIPPAAGTLFAVSRTIAGERTVFFEFLRIETRADGVFYVAQPRGSRPTDFKCIRMSGAEVVFENLQHDFPKRIIYRKNGDGSLTARVEGDGTEKEKPQDFNFQRMRK